MKPGSNPDRKTKLEELIRTIETNFQKLRKVYDAINEMMTDVQPRAVEVRSCFNVGRTKGSDHPRSAEPVVELCRTEEKFFGEDLGVTAVVIR